MKNTVICPHCGTRQSPKHRTCLSCGNIVTLTEAERIAEVDRSFDYEQTLFTKGVTLAARLVLLLELALLVVIIVIGNHNILPFFLPIFVVLGANFVCKYPLIAYRLRSRRSRMGGDPFSIRDRDFDNPSRENFHKIYYYPLGELIGSLALVAAYFIFFDELRL